MRRAGIAATAAAGFAFACAAQAQEAEYPGTGTPAPVAGKSVNVAPTRGTVLVKRRGARRFVRLTAAEQIPVGSSIDTRRGEIRLTSASGTQGGTQSGSFYDGLFVVRQKRARQAVTDLELSGGSFRGCPRPGGRRAAHPSRSARRRVRRLWGRANGRFRTRGRYSAAVVRGTLWLTQDRCDGTATTVREGKVAVRDSVRRRTVAVEAGQTYFSPSDPRRRGTLTGRAPEPAPAPTTPPDGGQEQPPPPSNPPPGDGLPELPVP